MAKKQVGQALKPKVPDIVDKKKYDETLEATGVGAQHKDGTSSQRGRTTIVFKDGVKTVVRENGKVLRPDMVKATKRMKMSVFNALEASNAITYVDKSKWK